jgi:hypothetical protein
MPYFEQVGTSDQYEERDQRKNKEDKVTVWEKQGADKGDTSSTSTEKESEEEESSSSMTIKTFTVSEEDSSVDTKISTKTEKQESFTTTSADRTVKVIAIRNQPVQLEFVDADESGVDRRWPWHAMKLVKG